jgi:hypothetical protein
MRTTPAFATAVVATLASQRSDFVAGTGERR